MDSIAPAAPALATVTAAGSRLNTSQAFCMLSSAVATAAAPPIATGAAAAAGLETQRV